MVKRVEVDAELEAVVVAYGDYQRGERRLAPLTVQMSSYGIRAFLAWRVATERGALGGIGPDELVEFLIHESQRLTPRSMNATIGALRGFVRFCFVTGVTASDMSGALPSVAAPRFTGMSKAVGADTVAALMGGCDRASANGRRDFAILTLMVRLGLRAVEVARMTLDDFDWRAGEVVVHGKGGRVDRLPIPADVGEAIVDYLRFGRRVSAERGLFLQAFGSATAMSRNAVVFVSRSASKKAGIPTVAGHRLRHTAATAMLASGASMREVGQVLRHDDDNTTAIYAKADAASLALVVRPWPAGITGRTQGRP